MMESLPRSNFEWVSKNVGEILETADDAQHGYLIEVDLKYPKELHDIHNDYPLCAEHMIPPNSSSKQAKLMKKKSCSTLSYTETSSEILKFEY